MSSHHIVRENQEPALLVEDFHALSAEYLGQILEWSPTIIINEENLDYFLSNDIKVDFLYAQSEYSFQEEIKLIKPVSTFVVDGLNYLIDHNYKAVNILAKELGDVFLTYADRINIVTFVDGIRYVLVKSSFEKWKTAGEKMFIDVSQIKSFNGLRFIDKNIFEVESDGFIQIEMNSTDFVFLGEEV